MEKMNRFALFVLVVSVAAVLGNPLQLYKKTNENIYRRVLVPVSSTVIPLDELPQIQVGVGFNVKNPPSQLLKPEGDVKLLTAKKSISTFPKKAFKKHSGVIVEEIEQ